jgi:hypothetical protein
MSRWVDAAAPEASVPKQRVGFDLEGMAVSKVDAAHYGVRVAMERKPGVFFSGRSFFRLPSRTIPTPRPVMFCSEPGDRFGPGPHVARERPKVSMA